MQGITSISGVLSNPRASEARDAMRAADARSFSQILAQTGGEDVKSPETARDAAEQLVTVALVQPLFQRMRASNNAAPPFGPGKGEQAFGGLLDAAMARKLTTKGSWSLVDQVAARLTAKMNSGVLS
ncbi:MAG: hypothetical protein ACK54H_08455 [Phycisphaerales bacterium]|jgi:Rod binding domain-containing protein